jgi:RNA polymerase sigma-70 factor (ECF subfamily)
MFSIAYRMLGSASEAEDVVQEAFLRLHRSQAEGKVVDSERAWLASVTTRAAIDELRSARARRETYFGPWLPEPLLTSREADGAELAEMADSLSLSFLVLLETLTPLERAVFLLREVFDYRYEEIATMVEKSEANCRQVFARARKRIDEGKPRFEVTKQQQDELAARFLEAVGDGDLDSLVGFLAADVVFVGDGGGKGRGLPQPVYGQGRVGRLLRGFFETFAELGARLERAEVNGEPGILCFDAEDRLINVFALEIADGEIQTFRSIINPDKLPQLGFPLSEIGRADRDGGAAWRAE